VQSPGQPPVTVLAGGGLPPPPGGYGQPQPGGFGQPQPFGGGFPPSPSSPGGSGRSGATVLLVVVAVLAFVGLSVAGFVGYRILSDDNDTGTDAADRSSATQIATTEPTGPTASTNSSTPTAPTPSDSESGTTVTDQQCRGGAPDPTVKPGKNADRVSGGALSIPVPDGYTPEPLYAAAFAWADNFTPVYRTIEENKAAKTSWLSIYGVGGLRKANGFTDPAQAAAVVMTCMAQSPDQYTNVTARKDLSSGEITVDGTDAFQLTSEIRVDNPDLDTEGDITQVIVVDMGDPDMFGLYIAQVPIGDQRLIDQQAAMVGRILVD
jgi:hypothetical protein